MSSFHLHQNLHLRGEVLQFPFAGLFGATGPPGNPTVNPWSYLGFSTISEQITR